MFAPVAAFEWRYQLKSPVFWVGCLIFFLLTFGATTVDQIQIGSRGNVNINSPFAILQTLGIMNVFAVFVVVAMVAGTVLRDDETGFAPILRSTRIGKGAYLTGRFVGSVAAALLVLASVPLAIAAGAAMPSPLTRSVREGTHVAAASASAGVKPARTKSFSSSCSDAPGTT
jgi:ABC-2 type transport system permease protein